jgi:hypothetical protein
LQIGHGIDPGSDFLKPDSGAGVPDRRFSIAGPIVIIVRQQTFMCQHLAQIVVLNRRAGIARTNSRRSWMRSSFEFPKIHSCTFDPERNPDA